MNTEHDKSDAALDNAMKAWRVPSPSPWLHTRATQNILSRVNSERAGAWLLAPLRLGSAFAAVLIFGLLLGAGLPRMDIQKTDIQVSEAQTEIKTDDMFPDLSAADAAEYVDLIALLW
jgi:hypothetical protein